jgi:hypothetical protein
MSETDNPWVWQGFYGSAVNAAAGKAALETYPATVVGAIIPPKGQPPVVVDVDGLDHMIAVQTRANNPVPTPAGMRVARPEIVGRLVGG